MDQVRRKQRHVYVVAGNRPGPLLADTDKKDLGRKELEEEEQLNLIELFNW